MSEQKSRRGLFFFLGGLAGCLTAFIFLFGIVLIAVIVDDEPHRFASDKVAVVPIEGEILDAREPVELLHKYADNNSVKAIVMRINSPGGAIAPSQEIYEAVRSTRAKSGKPIVASLDSVAASGGFYIASACDEIVANPGSITGSIGVIMQWMDLKDLLAWAKVKPETITSGTMKAAGSPYRELSEAEHTYLQHVSDQLHAQFIHAVAVGRKGRISEPEIGRIADGRVFTGEEALALKLVDKLGSLDDAIELAAKNAKVSGEPGLIYPRKRDRGLLDLMTGSSDAQTVVQRVLGGRGLRFLYKWN
ncbi:MAG TPA: signal peptide peptidase SppA [Thermoanaerobaculia bacterium]|nr:signal peptide peptidase SppA [Thermoanaerobaculia bacterium]